MNIKKKKLVKIYFNIVFFYYSTDKVLVFILKLNLYLIKFIQTLSFRGRRSRNKVSVGEPAEGSLD
jgi:hypothetical protein